MNQFLFNIKKIKMIIKSYFKKNLKPHFIIFLITLFKIRNQNQIIIIRLLKYKILKKGTHVMVILLLMIILIKGIKSILKYLPKDLNHSNN